MRSMAAIYALRGLCELVGAFLCLLTITALLFTRHPPTSFALSGLVMGFMILTPDGITRLLRSRQLAKFR
jgi:hypothetical protein